MSVNIHTHIHLWFIASTESPSLDIFGQQTIAVVEVVAANDADVVDDYCHNDYTYDHNHHHHRHPNGLFDLNELHGLKHLWRLRGPSMW